MEEKTKKEKLLKEYSFTISNNVSDFEKEIVGVDNIYEFFKKEYEFWSTTENRNNILNEYVNYFSDASRQLKDILDTYDEIEYDSLEVKLHNFKNHAAKQYQSNSSFKVIYSSSPKAQYLVDYYKSNKVEAEGAHQYFLNTDFNLTNNKAKVVGVVKAILFEAENEDKLYKRNNAERKAISKLSSDFAENLFNKQKEYSVFTQNMTEWKDALIEELVEWRSKYEDKSEKYYSDKETNLNDLEDLYLRKLQLEGPVQYWKKRAKKYMLQGIVWISLLTILILFTTWLLYSVLYDMPVAFGFKLFNGEPQAIRGVIVFFTIISFFAYLTRTFTKLTFSSFHLQRDAEEREQLTLVYLALIEKEAVSNDERKLVLQSLFSRSDTGLLGNDGNPTMPSFQNVIEKISK